MTIAFEDGEGVCRLTFENEYAVSFGASRTHNSTPEHGTSDAWISCEVAILYVGDWSRENPNGRWVTGWFFKKYRHRSIADDIVGGVESDDLAIIIHQVANLKPGEHHETGRVGWIPEDVACDEGHEGPFSNDYCQACDEVDWSRRSDE